ncbi:MAG: ABC transporter permease [Chloroflexaceae bacterium]|nr:ABC transporter permease [Chloroflexaceae bacterium]
MASHTPLLHERPAASAVSAGQPLRGVAWFGRLCRYPPGLIGLLIVVLYVCLALFAEAIAPYSASEQDLTATLQAPSAAHWFGTDQYGRDIFSRVLIGSRDILLLAFSSAALGLLLGTSVALVAGYYGGTLDELLMRAMDMLMSFPALLLALLILATFGSALLNLVVCIGIVFMPRVARVIRSVVLKIRVQDYVTAAQVRGESGYSILVREILPNARGPLVVEGAIRLSYAILIGASLGFLGLGLQPPSPDWGLQVSEGRIFLLTAPWVSVFPALAIASLVIGANLLADGLMHALQP